MPSTRLNIGCGPNYKQGWVNIDRFEDVHADLHASIFNLPYKDDEVDDVYCGHVLEHVRLQDVAGALREVYRVLKVGGRLCVVGPDVTRMQDMNDAQRHDLIYGSLSHDFDVHWWGCCEPLVIHFMEEAGFTDVVGVHPRDARLDEWDVLKGPMTDAQCAVLGVKGGSDQSA